jgi:hypothetical protein
LQLERRTCGQRHRRLILDVEEEQRHRDCERDGSRRELV